jgi:hypothetical protein
MLNLATQEAANLDRPKRAEGPLFLCDENGCPEGDEGSRRRSNCYSLLPTLRAGVHWCAFP